MKFKKAFAILLALAMVFSLALPAFAAAGDVLTASAPEAGEGDIVVLHSNDVHGAVEGYATMAALKAYYQAQGAQVLLVDAGDYIQGTTYVSVSQGATAIELMNLAGYDFAALGNHEFDYGYENLKTILEKAEFEVLSSNTLYNGAPAFGTHKVVELGGKKVGIFGLETPETATKAHPAKIKGVTFTGAPELYDLAQKEVDALKQAGAEYIICLGHLGVDDETAATANRSLDLLNHVTGINVFIDGHSHSTIDGIKNKNNGSNKVGDTYVTSSGTKFANFGVVTLKADGTVTTDLVSAADAAKLVTKDAKVAARADEIIAEIEAIYGATFAKTEVYLDGVSSPNNRTHETNMGDLITDAMLWYATKDGGLEVDAEHVVALTNGGGIRAAINAGDITRKMVNTVLPFGNTVAIVYVNGEALLEALEASTFCTPEAVGGFPQVAGIDFTINTARAYDQGDLYPGGSTYHKPNSIRRVTINSINGKAFDPKATYAVVTNDFTAAGGDTYYAFSVAPNIMDTGTPLDEALIAYITEELNGVVTAEKYGKVRGSIKIVNEPVGHDATKGDVIILHSNDVHGAVEGYATMAALKAYYQEQGAEVLLVDAGDYIQGTTYVSVSQGATAVELMNLAGYDFAALGNHEFDYGYENLKTILEKAEFEVLSANTLYNGEPAFGTHKVVELGGVKVGIFGLETPETATKAHPAKIKGVTFTGAPELYELAQKEVDALKQAGAEYIICLGHLGVDDETAATANRSIDLLEKVTGIDVFIDGHSHSTIDFITGKIGNGTNKVGDTYVTSTGTKFNNFGVVTLKADGTVRTELMPAMDAAKLVKKDAEVAARAAEIIAEIEKIYGATFAKTEVYLDGVSNPNNRTHETNMGDLITDAMLWYATKDGGLDVDAEHVVALTNGGGIRAAINAGDITRNMVNTVLPFGNTVAIVYVNGEALLEALEASTFCTPDAVGGFPQVSGIDFTINTALVYDQGDLYPGSTYYAPNSIRRVTINSINGKAFDPKATYAVVTNDFTAAGGDTYYAFSVAPSVMDTGTPLDEALIAYITEELDRVVTAEKYGEVRGSIKIVNEPIGPEVEAGDVIILHSNDVHGAVEGYATMAALKAYYEEKGAQVLLMDAGDYIQGTTYVSVSQGATAIELMNLAGYDFAALGNHEFDYGYENLKTILEKAEFEVLSANTLYDANAASGIQTLSANGVPAFGTHKVVELDGVKVGIFGLETPETATKAHPAKIKGVTFVGAPELYELAQKEVDALKGEGAEYIICLGHLGVDDETAATANRSIDLLEKVTGIDVFIDGHSHSTIDFITGKIGNGTNKVGDTYVTSTGTKFNNFGVVTLKADGTVTTELLSAADAAKLVTKDAEVAARAAEIIAEIEKIYGATFAKTEVYLDGVSNPNNRTRETNMGDLITDAMLWYATKDGGLEVDAEHVVALTNGGGIRAAINAGDITRNMVNTVLPFGNTVAIVYVSGEALLEALEASTFCTPDAVGGFPQVAGMKLTIDTDKKFDQGELYPGSTYYKPNSIKRVQINSINGKAFDPKATYAVVTNDFCAAGGDTYYAFSVAPSVMDTGTPLDEALIAYITEELNGVVTAKSYGAPQGRIKFGEWEKPEPTPATPATPTIPATGDDMVVELWLAMMVLSGTALVVTSRKKENG